MWGIHTKSKKVTSIKNEINKDIHQNLSRRTTEILHKMTFFNEWGKKLHVWVGTLPYQVKVISPQEGE